MKKEVKTAPSIKKLYAIITILPPNKRDLFMDLTEEFNINYHLNFLGKGGASNEIVELLGLKNMDKAITLGIIREEYMKDCIDAIEDKINALGINGVGFAIPLDSIMGMKNYLFLADLGGTKWKKN